MQFLCVGGFAQYLNNAHVRRLIVKGDTLRVDTLSIIPGSFALMNDEGILLDASFYKINYAEGLLYLNRKKIETSPYSLLKKKGDSIETFQLLRLKKKEDNFASDSFKVSYKTFPYLFSAEVKHKDASSIKPDLFGHTNPFNYNIESKSEDIFKMEGLNKSGSISRGISFGNTQEMAVNSNLNLQLSGHLSNNIDILLAASDNNIPIQPEGNTQQLQEFDKVFIQLSSAGSKLTAGDFQLTRPASYFMNFNKKAQGISFAAVLKINPAPSFKKGESTDVKKEGVFKTSLSAAVSKGKFARSQIQGVESNQGPYRLQGAENEPFIIILSGTEKVYIDGRLMDRGQENDYVINYNTSEITFTAKQQITKDKRIVVEFQYSDKNYARSLVHFGNDFESDKLKLHFNIYSEQDNKNQPVQQNLTDQQKQLLSRIGDTLSLAVAPGYDSIAFNTNEVLYQKKDTIIGSNHYHNVFLYSTNSTVAHFRVTFSNTGQGNGNYNQTASAANGKVFQWIAPDSITHKPRGSFEPIIQLITPKQKQMVTTGIEYAFSANSRLSVEAAASNNNINTFSSVKSSKDAGSALKINFDNARPIGSKQPDNSNLDKPKTRASQDSASDPLTLLTNVNYEYVQKNFSPIERYRSVEFERDWNRGNVTAALADQHIIGASLGLVKKTLGTASYKFNALFEGTNYNADKHQADFNFSKKGFNIQYNGSLLNSSSTSNTNFYRHKSGISKRIKWITLGIKDEFEQNKFTKLKKDSLLSNSYKFWEWQSYIQNADTSKTRYGLNYKQRTDFAVRNSIANSGLNRAAFAESYGCFFELLQNPNNRLKINAAYRRLQIIDTALTLQKPDNSLVSRIEYNFRLGKGFLSSNTFYEIGSGLEVKKEFSYIEVAAGLGAYTWIDYNNNGIKELNEFEIAAFPGQGTFIKVYTPTSDYIKVFTNQFSQTMLLNPSALWAGKTGVRKFISHFSNQTAFRADRKTTENDLAKAYNPFLNAANDISLVTMNSSFMNTLFINQSSSLAGLDLIYQDVRNKTLLVSGFDTRQNTYLEARIRWNMSKEFSWNISGQDGAKMSNSQYFSTRNYSILYYDAQPKFSYQPNTAFRAAVSFKYTDKKNNAEFGAQHANLMDYGAELKYNVLQKGSLSLKANYIQIKYNDVQLNTSLAFEMLDALKAGQNITWGLTYQRNLSNNMQLSFTYDGRKSEGVKAIHTGGAQVRAYF